jgi:predicted ATP-grasp superfamily ATP-dependent carboligase
MRVLIYEHTCALSPSEAGSCVSLLREGRAMLSAIVEDFARVAGVEVVTIEGAAEAAFKEEASRADYTLVIAPEFDDILLTRCRWVEEAGGRLLGPTSAAVQLAADKLALADYWARCSLPTPPCRLLLAGEVPASIFYPSVCKPRFGAGSQATFLLRRPEDLTAVWQSAEVKSFAGAMLFQPFVAGQSGSVAWLIGPKQQVPLAAAEQHLSADGRFHYQGGFLPLQKTLAERAVALTRPAIEVTPGLLGYVGVDIVLGDAGDGSQDYLIELNPRLTTSYIGLRKLAKSNLVQLMLQLARGEAIHEPEWQQQMVRFSAAGRILK